MDMSVSRKRCHQSIISGAAHQQQIVAPAIKYVAMSVAECRRLHQGQFKVDSVVTGVTWA